MTDLDLTEAAAAAQADVYGDDHSQHIARMAVTSAAPILSAQVERRVRETIANEQAEYPAYRARIGEPAQDAMLRVQRDLVKIARGGAA